MQEMPSLLIPIPPANNDDHTFSPPRPLPAVDVEWKNAFVEVVVSGVAPTIRGRDNNRIDDDEDDDADLFLFSLLLFFQ